MADTNPYTSTRVCEGCGKVMHNVYHAKRFCPACAEKRHRARTAAWWAKKKDEISSPYPKEETAAQRKRNAEERDAAGLSYGKYMLLKNKKPSGVTSTGEPAKG